MMNIQQAARWLLGQRPVLTTTLPQYKHVGRTIEVAGECYRITYVRGDEVWGRPVARPAEPCDLVVVESPLKHLRSVTN